MYLADRVIPMLPHKLSNGICSLNAGENRLALSCIMTVDKKGEIVDHVIAETVIRVDQRMSYTSVAKFWKRRMSRRDKNTKSWFRCLNRWQKFQGCFGNAGKERRNRL